MLKKLLLFGIALFFLQMASAATVCVYSGCENGDSGIHYVVPEAVSSAEAGFFFNFGGYSTGNTIFSIWKKGSVCINCYDTNSTLHINGFATIGADLGISTGLKKGDLNLSGIVAGKEIRSRTSYDINGTKGITSTLYVRNKAGDGECYLDINGGLVTKSNCT